jgi:hypothetical protein
MRALKAIRLSCGCTAGVSPRGRLYIDRGPEEDAVMCVLAGAECRHLLAYWRDRYAHRPADLIIPCSWVQYRDARAHVGAGRRAAASCPPPSSLSERLATWRTERDHRIGEEVAARVEVLWTRTTYRRPAGKWAGGEVCVVGYRGEGFVGGESVRAWSRNGKWKGLDLSIEIQAPSAKDVLIVRYRGELCLAAVRTNGRLAVGVQGRGLTISQRLLDGAESRELIRAARTEERAERKAERTARAAARTAARAARIAAAETRERGSLDARAEQG